MIASLHDPNTWQEYGLVGLFIFALLSLMVLFIRLSNKKDIRHEQQMQSIMHLGKEERERERQERVGMTERYVQGTNRLSDAIDGLSKEIACQNAVRERETAIHEKSFAAATARNG
jgi:hypothetical protein